MTLHFGFFCFSEEPVTEVTEIVKPEEPKVEEPPSEEPANVEVSQPSPSQSIDVEPEKTPEEIQETTEPVISSPRVSESEDNQQNELVLTVEENAMEEAAEILAEPEP